MNFLLLAALGQAIVKLLLIVVAIFLILLVLVQRGRGGGLAGALGGMGGSSAFGAKAGDVFTRVTIVAAFVWIVLCIAAVNLGPSSESRLDTGGRGAVAPPASTGPGLTAPAEEGGDGETSDGGTIDEVFSDETANGGADAESASEANSDNTSETSEEQE